MDKYKWDLTKLFKSDEDFNETINRVTKLLDEIVKYKGRIFESEETLLEFLKLDTEIDILIERIYIYAYLGYYDNMSDEEFLVKKEKANNIMNTSSSVRTFVTPEILSKDYKEVQELLSKNKELEKYKFTFEKIFRRKEHILSEPEELLLSNVSETFTTARDAFNALDNVDIDLGYIKDEEGKKVELTSSNYVRYITSKNRNVRKSAFKKDNKYYEKHINTLSALYAGKVKINAFISKTRKYNSILEMYLFSDKISTKLYENLIKITNKNTKYLKEYYKLKGKELGYKLHLYDTYVNTSSMPKKDIPYEEGIKIINKALSPLGEDYLKEFNRLLNSNVVDVYPKKAKRSGAFEWCTYGVDPYVSLNYENDIDSVSTLAHEMGHAMHSYYSNTNQDYINADYPIFLAEIASTVNEALLSNYLIKNSSDKDEKIYYLVEFLDKFKGTVYRQMMFAEFEYIIHKKYEKGEAITKDLLCKTYYGLNKKQFSGAVVVDKDIQYERSKIPHFYTSFYVYKYATGFISALLIADKLEKDKNFKDKYIEFLSSGCSDYPLELLNKLGIDLSDENTLNEAFQLFAEKVKLLNEYMNGE